jgi:hypothetical protein
MKIFKKEDKNLFILFIFSLLFIVNLVNANEIGNDRSTALSIAYKADQSIKELTGRGIKVNRLIDLKKEVNLALEKNNYKEVISLSNDIINLKNIAIDTYNRINKSNLLITVLDRLNVNTSKIKNNLLYGTREFSIENYESANLYVNKTYDEISNIFNNKFKKILYNLNKLKNLSIQNNISTVKINDFVSIVNKSLENKEYQRLNLLILEGNKINNSIFILINIKNLMDDVEKQNLPITRMNDITKEAELSLDLGDYNKVLLLNKDAEMLKTTIFDLDEDINKTRLMLSTAEKDGLEIDGAKELLNSAIDKFNNENFEEAQKLIKETQNNLREIKSSALVLGVIEKSRLKFNVIMLIKNNLWSILIIIILVVLFAITSYSFISVQLLKNKIKKNKNELNILKNLQIKTQREYFVKRTISKQNYLVNMDKYDEKMTKIKEILPVLERKLEQKQKNKYI